jgi:hypothetical protein
MQFLPDPPAQQTLAKPVAHGSKHFVAEVTVECDDDHFFTQSAAVDFGPTRLKVCINHNGVIAITEFRIVTMGRIRHLWCSWLAVSFGRALPIANRDIKRSGPDLITVEPPWPLDFRLHLRLKTKADSNDLMATLLT